MSNHKGRTDMAKLVTVRQGDVMLVRLDAVPEGAKPVKHDGSIVIALGEVTGHAHVIEAPWGALFRSLNGDTIVELPAEAAMVHEEHGTITLDPGVWVYRPQREYSPEAIRNVSD